MIYYNLLKTINRKCKICTSYKQISNNGGYKMEHNKNIAVYNELGKKIELELIDVVKIGEEEYVIVGPKDSDEAYAYKAINRIGNEIEYMSIGSGSEFNRVLEKYNSQTH